MTEIQFASSVIAIVMSQLKWNTPELHMAQPLDYLSQFPWIVTEANTRYTVNHTVSAMLPIP